MSTLPELVVWAPRARTLELVVGDLRQPFRPTHDGHFAIAAPPPETRYALSLDGGPPRPDPRAEALPDGVHGPSVRVDHARFRWSDAGFRAPPLEDAVIYELHVGTFSPDGTYAGVAERLDHLVDLGVTHVELMPVASFPGAHGWGYDGVGLYAPHAPYGTPDALKQLVDAAHARGLAVLLDVVYNHLGPDGNYLGEFGPYFTDRVRTPWGEAVNLDGPGSDQVRAFLIDNALMWLRDYHFDGLRLDAVHALYDSSATHFLEELSARVAAWAESSKRDLVLIAESDLNDPRVTRPRHAHGLGMDAQWSDDYHHALHVLLTGESKGYYSDYHGLASVSHALTHGFVFDGRHSSFRGRQHGRPLDAPDGRKLLGYVQTHDQVGNRACGDRISALVSEGRLRIAAALVMTAPFVPMLFQGEEWGASTPFLYFTAHQDAGLAEAVRKGRRAEFAAFGWTPEQVPDPQAATSFLRSILPWNECTSNNLLLQWHRALVGIRKQYPELRDGRLDRTQVTFDEAGGWLRMTRGRVSVVVSVGSATVVIPAPAGVLRMSWPSSAKLDGGTLTLPPEGTAVFTPAAD